ncbi:MAG: hypothetical protein FJ006_00055 [Chloroflexi bacterium]|nr:hypothetical protein [Chloroflexota bacterium]
MTQRAMQIKGGDLLVRIAEVATVLGQEGREFNRHLVGQFEEWNRVNVKELIDAATISNEHLIFYEAVAQTLGWLQQIPVLREGSINDLKERLLHVPVIYLQVLLEARGGLVEEAGQRLIELLDQSKKETEVKRPRRLLAVIAGLETWSRVQLPDVGPRGVLDLEEVQRLALSACGRARWTALAPLKMYAIYKLSKNVVLPTFRGLFPPMGTAVSRGIERIFGFTLGESENDYSISRGLHLRLADLAQMTIWDINSGFYRLGGGF